MREYRKRSRRASIILLLLLVSLGLSANSQKLYRSIDKEYINTTLLAIEAGILYPSYTPVTAAQLLTTLETIPEGRRGAEWQEVYNSISEQTALFKAGNSAINLEATVNLQGYFHSDDLPQQFATPYKDIPPMLSIFGEASIYEHSYLYVDFIEKDPILSHPAYSNFSTFVDYIDNQFVLMNYLTQAYQPFRSGLSAGGQDFNFQIGRNRQKLGRGISGNLFIGDNFVMQDYLDVSWTSKYFTYHMNVTHFDQQTGEYSFNTFTLSGNQQYRVVHTLTASPLASLDFSVSLGSLFQSTSAFDLRLFTPMTAVHNFNNFSEATVISGNDESNNMLSAELSWAFFPGWKFSFQFALDQAQLGYESTEKIPNAFGYLANIENVSRISESSTLHSYIELAYTDPYFYLNYKTDENGNINYNYDYILGYGMTGGADFQYSGYPYGPDSIVMLLGTEYIAAKWSAGADFLWWIHGEHGLYSKYMTLADYSITHDNSTPSAIYPQHFIKLRLQGSYEPVRNLVFNISATANWIVNLNNEAGRNCFYPTASLGVSFKIL